MEKSIDLLKPAFSGIRRPGTGVKAYKGLGHKVASFRYIRGKDLGEKAYKGLCHKVANRERPGCRLVWIWAKN